MTPEDLERHSSISSAHRALAQQSVHHDTEEDQNRYSSPVENTARESVDSIAPQDVEIQSNMPSIISADSVSNHSTEVPGVTSVSPEQPVSHSSTGTLMETTATQVTEGHNANAKVERGLPIRKSLGITGCIIIFGGSILTLLVIAFLIFLWAGEGPAGGQQSTRPWRQIMLRDWATRAVTLSALVLRSVAAAQASVCTSLVAALLLERRQVRLSKVAQMSVTRSVNNGPQQLIQAIFSSRSSRMIFNTEALLLILLALVTLGIQFTSTILLPDFDSARLVHDPATVRHFVSLSPLTQTDVTDIFATTWPTLQSSAALYGELESNSITEPDEHGVSHNGPKLRAFLPFEHQDRIRMRSYKGTAFTLKTEVSCMRPSLEARVQVHPWSLDVPYASMAGEISYEQTFKDASINHTLDCFEAPRYEDEDITLCLPTKFNCTVPSQPIKTYVGWAPAMCRLDTIGMTRGEADIDFWQTSDDLYGPTSMIFLAFAVNGDFAYYDANETQGRLGTPAPYGEWNSYELYPGSFLNVSLCFSTLNTTISEVEMTSSTDLTEPEFKWSAKLNTSNVEGLKNFMGGEDAYQSNNERGIFSIQSIQHPVSLSAFAEEVNASSAKDDISFSEWALWHGPSAAIWAWASNNQSLILCTSCQMRGLSTLKDGTAVFTSVIDSSNRVAVAIDTYLAKLVQNFYYLMFPLFDVPADVEVVFSSEEQIPKKWGGLIAVLVMVSVYLICVWVITALYMKNVRYTRQGDFWHAVSQLISESTQSVLEKSNELKDDDVEKMLKGNDPLVTINRSVGTGKVVVLDVRG
ncbi:hypothetical protein F5Y13DRAFT_204766 [Hypoxylon sp. FL1857]|nr:hypothetical protein F5Y13DRAFT_204766 [Hypoxylon sp. FL1857]